MNEKPILFNAEMVNAILSGRKTQTRRIMKSDCMEIAENDDGLLWPWREDCERGGDIWYPCPLGAVGDQLWVRECFSDLVSFGFFDGAVPDFVPDYWYWAGGNPKWGDWTKPKPSIHMPRTASRINLLITGVRVERLQDISEQDAAAEGCLYGKGNGEIDLAVRPENHFPTLWASIYGAESWQANPWVWVIDFERMEAK
ncbi:hypothetical protein BF17_16580 [Yersinia similis]|uniref:Phage-related protein n=1 Tax=Yersinia similis TaxID=367190 RepID=A0ABM5Q0B6_9GAMM|nr:hypothetical protein [Yersinia similis]AHK20727.1 hypothetical protein BF17_16580 [Yersinia similis]CFQ60304.1 phage-like protein [Yersinia similis]